MANQQQFFSFMAPPPSETAVQNERIRTSDNPRNPKNGHGPSRHVAPVPKPPAVSPPAKLQTGPPNRDSVLKTLRAKVGCVTTARQSNTPGFSTGCEAIDAWLPTGSLHPYTLTEWIAAHDSAAAGSLSLLAATRRLHQSPNRPLVIVDCEGSFYPPAAVSLGVPSERMILLRPRVGADAIWAIDQALRSRAVAAVWASLPMQIDDRDARRLQLAAETGRTPGLFVRGFQTRGKPSFSEVQFYVSQQTPRPSAARNHTIATRSATRSDFETISVTLDRVRGGVVGQQLELQIDDSANVRPLPPISTPRHETAAEHLASKLANPTTAKRTTKQRPAAQRPAAQRQSRHAC